MISIQKTAVGFVGTALLVLGAAAPASALETNVSGGAEVTAGGAGVTATADAKIQIRITKAKERASQEIDRRVKALNELNIRVQTMTRVSASQKATLATSIAGQVSALTTLKAKIAADTDLPTLKTDIASITANYRIFMLIMPQARVQVAADKLNTVSASLTALAVKLKAHIDAVGAAGKDVSAMTASYTEMSAMIADANVQSTAAVSLVASLTPDYGDDLKRQANEQALKDARAKIKAGLKDIDTARSDARAIVSGLKGLGVDTKASARGSATIQ